MTPVHHIHVRSKDISGYDDPTRRVKGQMHRRTHSVSPATTKLNWAPHKPWILNPRHHTAGRPRLPRLHLDNPLWL